MNNSIQIGNTEFPLDFRGYLKTYSLWSPQLMEWFAQQEQVELSNDHVLILKFIRRFFKSNKVHPVVRIVTIYMAEILGEGKGTIKFFHVMFPKGIHQAYRIAGLPPFVQSV